MGWVKLSLADQWKFAKSEDPEIRIQFSWYPMSPEVADYMIEHETDKEVFARICTGLFYHSNTDISAGTLKKAARKKVELCGVWETDIALAGIALHLNTDVETLTYLYGFNNRHVNWGLASNPNTPREILDELSDLNIFDIHDALLHNPNTSKETKDKLWLKYPGGFFTAGSYYEVNGIEIKASGN